MQIEMFHDICVHFQICIAFCLQLREHDMPRRKKQQFQDNQCIESWLMDALIGDKSARRRFLQQHFARQLVCVRIHTRHKQLHAGRVLCGSNNRRLN